MFPQAQLMVTSQIPFDVPLGALTALGLLVVLASGIVFESGVLWKIRAWLVGGHDNFPRRVATAGHRG